MTAFHYRISREDSDSESPFLDEDLAQAQGRWWDAEDQDFSAESSLDDPESFEAADDSGFDSDRAEQEHFEDELPDHVQAELENVTAEHEDGDEPEEEVHCPTCGAHAALEALEGEWEADDPELAEREAGGQSTAVFPSGARLSLASGAEAKGEEYFDPFNSGNPLLDVGGKARTTRLSKNFVAGEFAVGGGKRFGKARIDPELVRCLQAVRDHLGKAVTITSAYRSFGYNQRLYKARGKKATTSRHSSGQAADIKVRGMSGIALAEAALLVCPCDIGIGLGQTFVHIDMRGRYARWTYAGVPNSALTKLDQFRETRCLPAEKARVRGQQPPSTSPVPVPSQGGAVVPAGPFGTIVVRDGYTYPLHPEDVLWAARMVYGEGGADLGAVLWATTQRFAGIPRRRALHGTYRAMIRLWSEPIMAARLEGGSYCGKHTASSRCKPIKLARRALIQSLAWDPALSATSVTVQGATARLDRRRWEEAKRVTLEWALGRLANSVPKAIDMIYHTLPKKTPFYVVKKAGTNVFWGHPTLTKGWTDHHVRITRPGTSGTTGASSSYPPGNQRS